MPITLIQQRPIIANVLLLAWLLALARPVHAQQDLLALEEQAMQAAVAHIAPSVVRIETVGGLDRVGQVLLGTGPTTGLIVSPDGYVVSSAYNFVQRPASILVILPDGTPTPAKLVATDRSRMITLLKVDVEEPLPTPETVPRDAINVGQWAVAVGRTFPGDSPNISVGIISAKNRIWNKAIQTDAKVSPSNYGGPLIDLFGRVIGVLVPLSPGGTGELAGVQWYDSGIGFAIPLEHIQSVIPRLQEGEDLYAGVLGVSLRGKNPLGGPVVLAASLPNSPAADAGLIAGDRIVEVDGAEVRWQNHLFQQLKSKYAGDTVHLVALRGNQRLEFEVELAEHIDPYAQPFLGFLPRRDSEDGAAIAVRYVYPESPADVAGVRVGDVLTQVNDQKVTDRQGLLEQLAALQPGDEVSLLVRRDEHEIAIQATLATMPEEIPAELPAARDDKPREKVELPTVGDFQLSVPGFPNKCLAYVPENYDPRVSHALVIWLDGAEPTPDDVLLQRWRSRAIDAELIVLAPRSTTAGKWTRLDLPFVLRAIAQIQKIYSIDTARLVVHGQQSGGMMAYALAFGQRDVVRGVAVVDAPLMVKPPSNEPLRPLAIYSASLGKSPSAARIRKGIKQLREQRYPLTQCELSAPRQYLSDQQLDALVRWIDSLDRF